MKAIEPSLVKDNFIEIIGKEWMLVSAGDKDKFNMMTASWGSMGFLWNKPVVMVFVRFFYFLCVRSGFFLLLFCHCCRLLIRNNI